MRSSSRLTIEERSDKRSETTFLLAAKSPLEGGAPDTTEVGASAVIISNTMFGYATSLWYRTQYQKSFSKSDSTSSAFLKHSTAC